MVASLTIFRLTIRQIYTSEPSRPQMMDKLKLKWKSVNTTIHRKQPTRMKRTAKNLRIFANLLLILRLKRWRREQWIVAIWILSMQAAHTHASVMWMYWFNSSHRRCTYGTRICHRNTHTHTLACELIWAIHQCQKVNDKLNGSDDASVCALFSSVVLELVHMQNNNWLHRA